MSKRLVLLGAAQGPWCGINKIKSPVLHVSGLIQGHVKVELPDNAESTIYADGEYPLQSMFGTLPTDFIRCSATHPTKKLICTVQAA